MVFEASVPHTCNVDISWTFRKIFSDAGAVCAFGTEKGFVCASRFTEVAKGMGWLKIAMSPQIAFNECCQAAKKELETQISMAHSD